jgi:cobaltochelatase CobT
LAENHEAVRAKEGDDRTAKGYLGDAAFTAPMEIDVSKREVWKNIESMSPDCDTWKNMCAFFKLRSYTSKFFDQQWLNATARVKATVAPTQAKLQEAFMATSARNWAGGYDTGSLDPKALVRAYQGREGAFRRKDSGVDVNAAVTLLVDCSGSMDGTPMEVAGDMALALSMVLERMGVAVEVRGFTGDWGIYGGPVHADFVMKPFAKTVSQCRDGLGAMKYMASTANMDYVHVASASSSLMRREEEKKLLVVLSDGSTCGGHKELRELCRAIHCNLPIQLLGVGVMDTSVQSYYPDFVVVRNISDLSNVVAGRISQALMGRGLAGVKEAA